MDGISATSNAPVNAASNFPFHPSTDGRNKCNAEISRRRRNNTLRSIPQRMDGISATLLFRLPRCFCTFGSIPQRMDGISATPVREYLNTLTWKFHPSTDGRNKCNLQNCSPQERRHPGSIPQRMDGISATGFIRNLAQRVQYVPSLNGWTE